jgi:hypothetical protein
MINTVKEVVDQKELDAFFTEVELPKFCKKIKFSKGRITKHIVEYKGDTRTLELVKKCKKE